MWFRIMIFLTVNTILLFLARLSTTIHLPLLSMTFVDLVHVFLLPIAELLFISIGTSVLGRVGAS